MSDKAKPPDGWDQWRQHVLITLEALSERCERMGAELVKVQLAIAGLKIKSGIWGVFGASVPILIAWILWLLTKG